MLGVDVFGALKGRSGLASSIKGEGGVCTSPGSIRPRGMDATPDFHYFISFSALSVVEPGRPVPPGSFGESALLCNVGCSSSSGALGGGLVAFIDMMGGLVV